MRALLRHRDARLFLGGQTASLFGDSALFLVLGIWTKELTGSTAAAGLVFFVYALPQLAAPFAGWLVDRLPRRPTLMVVHGVLIVVVSLLLFVDDRGDVWIIYVVAGFYGTAGTFGSACRAGLLKTMLPDELLADANGFLQTAQQGLRLISPLVGAGLYTVVGGGAVALVDAATFAVSIATLALLRIREPAAEPPQHSFLREVAAGAHHIWTTLPLRQIVGAASVALLVIGFAETLIFAVVDEGLGRPPAFLGVLEAFQGAGAVAGGLTAAAVLRRIGDGRLAGAGLVLFAIGDTMMVSTSVAVVAVGFTLAGAGIAWAVVGLVTSLQRRTPPQLQGRVTATSMTAIAMPQTFSIAFGALFVTIVDYRLLLVVMGVVTAACGLYLVTRRTFTEPVQPVEPIAVLTGAEPTTGFRVEPSGIADQ